LRNSDAPEPSRTVDHCKRAVEAALDMLAAMPFLRSELVRRIDGIQSNPEARRWASKMNIRIGMVMTPHRRC
jgi:hypothetical protein